MEDKALDKIDIQSELKVLSPIQKKSIELRIQAQDIEITDKVKYVDAKKVRKALITHRTTTKDLRLTFTRKLDNLKDQFIKKQDEVLEDSLRGEEIIKEKIAAWEKAEQERKEAEEKRIKDIVAKLFDTLPISRQESSPEDVKRERARIKMELGLLDPKDRARVAIKNAVEKLKTDLDEQEQFIMDRLEQEEIAKQQKEEQARLDAERKALEEATKAVTPEVKKDWDEAAKVYEAPAESIPKENEPMYDTNTLVDSARKSMEVAVEKTDALVMEMLNTYGFKVDPLNAEESLKELKKAGYELIHEVDSYGSEPRIHKYKLMRLVDQVEIKVNTSINLGE